MCFCSEQPSQLDQKDRDIKLFMISDRSALWIRLKVVRRRVGYYCESRLSSEQKDYQQLGVDMLVLYEILLRQSGVNDVSQHLKSLGHDLVALEYNHLGWSSSYYNHVF